jgi:hypothetical protein
MENNKTASDFDDSFEEIDSTDYQGLKAPSRRPLNNPVRTVNKMPGYITQMRVVEITEEETVNKDGSPGKMITWHCEGPKGAKFDVFTDGGLRNAVERSGLDWQNGAKFDVEFLGQKQFKMKDGRPGMVNVYAVYEPTW